MSDTRWAKVEECQKCEHHWPSYGPRPWCHLQNKYITERPSGYIAEKLDGPFPEWCPLPRAGDIPEVKALREAARAAVAEWKKLSMALVIIGAMGTKFGQLDASLVPFEEGEEK